VGIRQKPAPRIGVQQQAKTKPGSRGNRTPTNKRKLRIIIDDEPDINIAATWVDAPATAAIGDEIGATLLTREGIKDREDNNKNDTARVPVRSELIPDALRKQEKRQRVR
jgi:hypothetical protein